MSTKKCAVVYFYNNKHEKDKISDMEVWLNLENCGSIPSMWIDFDFGNRFYEENPVCISLFSTELDCDSELTREEIPNLLNMSEEEYFQYSILNPFFQLGNNRIEVDLVKEVIKFAMYEYNKSPTKTNTKDITFVY